MTWYGTIDGTAAKSEAIAQQGSVWRPLGDWWRALSQDDPVTYRYVLLLRFALANAIAFALVGAAIGQGWVSAIVTGDYAIYSLIIVGIFVVGLLWRARTVRCRTTSPGSKAATHRAGPSWRRACG